MNLPALRIAAELARLEKENNRLRDELAAAREEIRILRLHSSAIKLNPECPRCKGTGWVPLVRNGILYGEITCPACETPKLFTSPHAPEEKES